MGESHHRSLRLEIDWDVNCYMVLLDVEMDGLWTKLPLIRKLLSSHIEIWLSTVDDQRCDVYGYDVLASMGEIQRLQPHDIRLKQDSLIPE